MREITFLEAVSLSLLTQHRDRGPYGLEGGEPGCAGRQRVIQKREDGSNSSKTVELGAVDEYEVESGDRLILETPGGGGWGAPEDER